VQLTCRHLLSSALTPSLLSLTARQRKELTERLQAQYASETVCQQQLCCSRLVQDAVSRRDEALQETGMTARPADDTELGAVQNGH